MAQTRWDTSRMPDLSGKTAVVTGANSGLGWHTTAALAGKGAHVVLACRNPEKTAAAMAEIRRLHPNASLEHIPLDLADLASVAAFADAYRTRHRRLDILCNNAGLMFAPRGTTKDGFETHFGTNHLGHFALTGRLMDMVLATPQSRVVTVASEFARLGRIRLDDLNGERRYSRVWAYANAKLANLMTALELQRRLERTGAQTISVAAHPGYSATNLQSAGVGMGRPDALARFGDWSMRYLNRWVAQSAAMGALPSLLAASDPDVKGGDYYGPDKLGGLRGYPHHAPKPPQSKDAQVAAGLWAASEEMTGVSFP
jgi:NAD(P)-dependent dehydrogenase (short-subunit alcohol dehydrogenase family)